jgi:hypothetical protein
VSSDDHIYGNYNGNILEFGETIRIDIRSIIWQSIYIRRRCNIRLGVFSIIAAQKGRIDVM